MPKYLKHTSILFLIFLFSCNSFHQNKKLNHDILGDNQGLFEIIDSFTNQVRCAGIKDNYPSTHVYFKPYKDDTIMTITCYHSLSKYDFWWNNKLMHDSWWLNF